MSIAYKFTRTVAGLLCGLFLLAGCNEEPRSIIMAKPPESDLTGSGLPEAEIFDAAETPQDVEIALSTLTHNLTGIYYGTEEGCYKLATFTDGTADIHYFSYAAGTVVKLAGPQKQTQLQLGQVFGCRGGVSPVVLGGMLYLFQQGGAQGLNDDYGRPVQAILQRLTPDASMALWLTFPAQYTFQNDSAVLTDGSNLYFLMVDSGNAPEAEQAEAQAPTTVLMRVDGGTMEYKELQRLPAGYEYTILGSWAKGPVVCAADLLPAVDDPTFGDLWANRTFTLNTLGMASGALSPLMSWGQDFTYAMDGSRFYYWNDADASVWQLDANTGAQQLLAQGFVPQSYEKVQIQQVILDNKLRVQVATSGPSHSYAIDLASGGAFTPGEIEMEGSAEDDDTLDSDEAPASTSGVSASKSTLVVYAETSTHFLVQSDERWVRRELVDPTFDPATVSNTRFNEDFVKAPVYSLILKADYWAGKKQFVPITDEVYT